MQTAKVDTVVHGGLVVTSTDAYAKQSSSNGRNVRHRWPF